MRRIKVFYTIYDVIEVPDDATDVEIQARIADNATDLGIYSLVDDSEWECVE